MLVERHVMNRTSRQILSYSVDRNIIFLGQVITTQQEYKAVKIQGLYKDRERQNPLS